MIDMLFAGIGWTDIALTLSHVAVGAFFVLSGYHKLFNAERHRVLAEELRGLGIHVVGFNQWWVPTADWLYLPEILYVFMLITVVSAGAGPYSLDAFLPLIRKHGA